jgi:UDP-N-acetylglucosamine 3-dehydrogenase
LSRLRIGVVGYGAIGRHHARNLAALPDVELAGIAELDEAARAQAAGSGFRTFPTLAELLATGVDGVVLSVPTSLHHEFALQCLEAGIALLVEKPIALTVSQGREIIECARKKHTPLMVGYVERYNPAVVALREFMLGGGLGKIYGISARRLGAMPARIKDANVLIDIGVHDIDMAAFVLDAELVLRSAQGGRAILDDRVDFAFLALEGAGVPVHIESNWITPVKFRDVLVTGGNGLCHVDYVTQTARFAAAREFPAVASFEGVVEQYKTGEFVELSVEKEEPLRRELRTFAAGIRGAALPDPALALISLRIAEEATAMIESQNASLL